MADFSAPSFSLGLDFDVDIADIRTDAEEEEEKQNRGASGEHSLRGFDLHIDKDFVDSVAGEDDAPLPPTPAFKRLKKGSPLCPLPSTKGPSTDGSNGNALDDIEEFSSPERGFKACSLLPSRTAYGNSKLSLSYQGTIKTLPRSNLRAPKSAPASCSSTLTCLDACGDKKIFPNLTISPLRKIHLSDSDSDDPSPKRGAAEETSSLRKSKPGTDARKVDRNKGKSMEKLNIPTPALDDFCEEYFRKKDDSKMGEKNEFRAIGSSSSDFGLESFVTKFDTLYQNKRSNENMELEEDQLNSHPPVYQYMYHDDTKIQNLVRERLRYFVPLGAVPPNDREHLETPNLCYKNQFCPRERLSRAGGAFTVGTKGSSKRKITTSTTTGAWMNPRSKPPVPKDAGKRRVRAEGHWFTDQDGRKVYVNKDGQEFSGRTAYRRYKKETRGFGRLKKKVASKNAAKKRQK